MTGRDRQLDDLIAEYLQQVDEGAAIDARQFIAEYSSEVKHAFLEFLQLEGGIYRLHALGGIGRDSSASGRNLVRSEPESPGDVIGGYRLIREIARGGMGIVYVGQDTQTGDFIALKLLRGAIRNARTYQRRLERESRAIAALNHPHVVQPIDSGIDHGSTYLAMRLIDGVGLDRVLQHWRLDIRDDLQATTQCGDADHVTTPLTLTVLPVCVSVFRQRRLTTLAERLADIADALHAAHENGIVHRDVKPSNILIDVQGKVWLTDFGLACVGDDETELTETGDVLGTLAYMSPEQASGHRGRIDRSSDIYSLGVSLYELATLSKPFVGTRQKIIHDLLAGRFALPSKVHPDVPRELEAIICKAMEVNPHNRYATAKDLAADLRRFADGARVQANVPGRVHRALRWCERNPLATFATVAGCLLAVVAAFSVQAINSWSLSKLNAQLSSANEQLTGANRDLDASQARLLRELYVADMRSAFEAYNDQDLPAIQMLLEPYGAGDSGVPRSMPQRLLEELVKPPQSRVLCRHDKAATQFVVADDDSYVLSAGHDGQVIQSTLHGEELARFQIGGKLDALAIDEHTELFLTGKNIPVGFNAVDFYTLGTGKIARKGIELWNGVEEIAVAPSGNWFAAAERYQDVVVFGSNGRVRARWNTESRNESLEFVDDDHLLGLFQESETSRVLYVWNIQSGEATLFASEAECFALARDSTATPRFVLVGGGHELQIYEWSGAKRIAFVRTLSSRIRCVDIRADGQFVLAGHDDGSVSVWQMRANKEGELTRTQLIPVSSHRITDIQFLEHPDSRSGSQATSSSAAIRPVQFLTSSEDGLVQLHSCPGRNPQIIHSLEDTPRGTLAEPFRDMRRENLLYFPYENGELVCLDVATLAFRTIYHHSERIVTGICTHDKIYVADSTGVLEIDRESGERIRVFSALEPARSCRSLAVLDGTLFALYGDKCLSIELENSSAPKIHPLPVDNAMRLTTTGLEAKSLLIISPQAKLMLREDGQLHAIESVHSIKDGFVAVQASLDQRLLATARNTDAIEVLDLHTQSTSILSGHRQKITDLEFIDDDRSLMSVSHDGTIRFWDLATERELGRLEIPEACPHFLFYFHEESLMVTARHEGDVQVWRVKEF